MNKALLVATTALLAGTAPFHAQGPAHALELGPETTAKSVAGWPMPWQISRVSLTALRSEDIVTAWVPGKGMVRGTQASIDSIGRPLPTAGGPNRTMAACAEQVQSASANARAESVEWASASREHHLKDGNYYGIVEFRITYPTDFGYDVRDQPLVCVTKPDGTIIDAYMADSKEKVETPSRYTALELRARLHR